MEVRAVKTSEAYRAACINATNDTGESPVYAAAKKDSIDTLRVLVSAGADVQASDQDGRSPLLAAAQAGSIAAVRIVIAAGADVEAADQVSPSEQIHDSI